MKTVFAGSLGASLALAMPSSAKFIGTMFYEQQAAGSDPAAKWGSRGPIFLGYETNVRPNPGVANKKPHNLIPREAKGWGVRTS
jgi:hypothetical protein